MKACIVLLVIVIVLILVIRLWPPGDVDFSGKVTLTDLVILKAAKLNFIQRIVGDLNHDGCIDTQDYELLKQELLNQMND